MDLKHKFFINEQVWLLRCECSTTEQKETLQMEEKSEVPGVQQLIRQFEVFNLLQEET